MKKSVLSEIVAWFGLAMPDGEMPDKRAQLSKSQQDTLRRLNRRMRSRAAKLKLDLGRDDEIVELVKMSRR